MIFARRITFCLLLFFFLLVGLPTTSGYHILSIAHADKDSRAVNPAMIRAELEDLRKRSERETKRLAKLNAERTKISTELERLEEERGKTVEKQKRLQDSIETLGREAEEVKLLVFGAKLQMEQQRDRLEQRLVAMYKAQRRAPHADYLFQANSATDLLKRARYLTSIAEHDRSYIDRLLKLVKKGQGDRIRLEKLLGKRRESLTALKEAEARLEQQRIEKASLLREQDAKAEQQKVVLAKLQSAADRLESVLSKLMGETGESVSIEPTSPDEPKQPKFKGRGLARMKGKLIFPVVGRLLQKFGKQRHKEFTDMLFKKGLEVLGADGASVNAVAPGKVLFTQKLPGYGRVVILDHGKRYYTLYGRLGSTRCKVGQLVEAGEEVAVLGPVDRAGSNFYFELRIRGKATNPVRFFANPPTTAPTAN